MLAVCTVFSVCMLPSFCFFPLEEVKRVGSRIALGLFFRRKVELLKPPLFGAWTPPPSARKHHSIGLRWLQCLFCPRCLFSPGQTTLQLHISCNDEDLGVVYYFRKHPFPPLLRRGGDCDGCVVASAASLPRRDSNLVDSASSIRLSQRLSHACLSINKSIL